MAYLTERNTLLLVVYAEILVLGTGERLERINPSVLALLKKKGIAVEVQDTVKYARCLSAYALPDNMTDISKGRLSDCLVSNT